MEDAVLRNALGRPAHLGDLYNIYTDNFVGFSIFNQQLPKTSIEIRKLIDQNTVLVHTGNIAEKFSKLEIPFELQTSISAGMVSLDGHARYLDRIQKSKRAVESSLIITHQTREEKLIFTEKLEEYISEDAIDLGLGTHFVGGIIWGTHSVLTLECTNLANKNRDHIQNVLTKYLRKLITDEEFEPRDDISFYLFSDIFSPAESVRTIQDAKNTIKKLPNLLKMINEGKGKPISYLLIPLSKLSAYITITVPEKLITPVDENMLNFYCSCREETFALSQEIHDLLYDFRTHSFCIPDKCIKKLVHLKMEMERHDKEMKLKFRDLVGKLRKVNESENTSKDEFASQMKSEFSTDEVKMSLDELSGLSSKIQFVKELINRDVIYISKGESLETELERNKYSRVSVLFFNMDSNETTLGNDTKQHFLCKITTDKSRISSGRSYSPRFFMAVDLDMKPELEPKNFKNGIVICEYEDGLCVNPDSYGSYLRYWATCYAKTSFPINLNPKPSKRVELKLPCPKSFSNCKHQCKDKEQNWHCFQCKETLAFGFDEHFYCSCGQAPASSFTFRCNDDLHGPNFVPFAEKRLWKLLKAIPEMNELNILILGVTGVGKSTWINSFLNYLEFPSLEEASKGQLRSVTSTSFQMTDDNDIVHKIHIGEDENECLKAGQSATQDVKAHVFPIGDVLLRLIDTPGIGDVRGVEQDKENFQKILKYLKSLKWLNGICILLKPNESRLTVLFEFCIKELLAHLHRSAVHNIVFCFTHSRETFYKPGDTWVSLGELLWKNEIELSLQKETMYYMDNESFRFLCAVNQDVIFNDTVKKSFSESWNISVEETNRLISYIKKLHPHVIRDTISLNTARQNIIFLTKPIADISKNIQLNLTLIKQKQDQLKSSKKSEEELAKMLYLDTIALETEALDHPRTVCGKCVEYHPSPDGVSLIEYVRHCHPHCYLEGVPVNIVGDARLQQCWAMANTLHCTQCGCPWDQHLHITYVQNQVIQRVLVPDVQSKIAGKRNERQKFLKFIEDLEQFRNDLEYEQKQIMEASVRFGRYLSHNAILPYNDVLGKYIDHLIEKEEEKAAIDKDDALLKRLRLMRAAYGEEDKALKRAMEAPNAEELTYDEFRKLLKRLYTLKINGQQLKNAIEQASQTDDSKKRNYEYFHNRKREGDSRFTACHAGGYFQRETLGRSESLSLLQRGVQLLKSFWKYLRN